MASAAARVGKRVLHLDDAAVFGGMNATWSLSELFDLTATPEKLEPLGFEGFKVIVHGDDTVRAGARAPCAALLPAMRPA